LTIGKIRSEPEVRDQGSSAISSPHSQSAIDWFLTSLQVLGSLT